MLPGKMVEASLSLVAGKHTQLPNVVLVPAGAKSFPVTVQWSMHSEESYVIGSADPDHAHQWCVLDAELNQVMRGAERSGGRGSKKAEAMVSRTLHGGGAHNPRLMTVEFTGSRLKNGASYLLVASRHGVVAAGEFVAVREPRRKAAPKKKASKKAPARPKKAPARPKKATARKKGRKKVAA